MECAYTIAVWKLKLDYIWMNNSFMLKYISVGVLYIIVTNKPKKEKEIANILELNRRCTMGSQGIFLATFLPKQFD